MQFARQRQRRFYQPRGQRSRFASGYFLSMIVCVGGTHIKRRGHAVGRAMRWGCAVALSGAEETNLHFTN
jgi:hypothetical protein